MGSLQPGTGSQATGPRPTGLPARRLTGLPARRLTELLARRLTGPLARRLTVHRRPTVLRGLAAILACATLGCGGGGAPAEGPAPNEPAAAEPAPSEPDLSTAELEALYRARVDSARTRFTEADVRFMRDMMAHHTQALVMADLAEDRAASPAVQTLAARIDNAQRDEIATIERWLADRDQPIPDVRVEDTRVLVGGMDHAAHMTGMLTADEMAALERASGPAFDRLFLESMIRHHRGAVVMVDTLFGTDGAGQDEEAFRFATDVRVDQVTEIARMERMLEALPQGADRP